MKTPATTTTTTKYSLYIPLKNIGGFYFPLTKAQNARVELHEHEGHQYAIVKDGYFAVRDSGVMYFKKSVCAECHSFYVVIGDCLFPAGEDPIFYSATTLEIWKNGLKRASPVAKEWIENFIPHTGKEGIKAWQEAWDYKPRNAKGRPANP